MCSCRSESTRYPFKREGESQLLFNVKDSELSSVSGANAERSCRDAYGSASQVGVCCECGAPVGSCSLYPCCGWGLGLKCGRGSATTVMFVLWWQLRAQKWSSEVSEVHLMETAGGWAAGGRGLWLKGLLKQAAGINTVKTACLS